MPKKLKIFATGDFHGDRTLAENLAERATKEEVDIIILNGDIVEENKIEGIVGPFARTKKSVFLIPGNHESIATINALVDMYGSRSLHGYYARYGDVGLFGCGGANCGMTSLSEDEIFETLKKGFEKIKDLPKKVMVTHTHPAGTVMEKFSSFVRGSEGLRKAIETFKPDVLICGHVHEAEGIEERIGSTLVMNVGKKGKIFEI